MAIREDIAAVVDPEYVVDEPGQTMFLDKQSY